MRQVNWQRANANKERISNSGARASAKISWSSIVRHFDDVECVRCGARELLMLLTVQIYNENFVNGKSLSSSKLSDRALIESLLANFATRWGVDRKKMSIKSYAIALSTVARCHSAHDSMRRWRKTKAYRIFWLWCSTHIDTHTAARRLVACVIWYIRWSCIDLHNLLFAMLLMFSFQVPTWESIAKDFSNIVHFQCTRYLISVHTNIRSLFTSFELTVGSCVAYMHIHRFQSKIFFDLFFFRLLLVLWETRRDETSRDSTRCYAINSLVFHFIWNCNTFSFRFDVIRAMAKVANESLVKISCFKQFDLRDFFLCFARTEKEKLKQFCLLFFFFFLSPSFRDLPVNFPLFL